MVPQATVTDGVEVKTLVLIISFALAKFTALAYDGAFPTAWIERDGDVFRYVCGDEDGNGVSCTTEPGSDECGE